MEMQANFYQTTQRHILVYSKPANRVKHSGAVGDPFSSQQHLQTDQKLGYVSSLQTSKLDLRVQRFQSNLTAIVAVTCARQLSTKQTRSEVTARK